MAIRYYFSSIKKFSIGENSFAYIAFLENAWMHPSQKGKWDLYFKSLVPLINIEL